MSLIYLLALLAVGLAVVALTVDSMLAVTRKPQWAERGAHPTLQLVPAVERRTQALPFVGQDRRGAGDSVAAGAADTEPRVGHG